MTAYRMSSGSWMAWDYAGNRVMETFSSRPEIEIWLAARGQSLGKPVREFNKSDCEEFEVTE